MTMIPAAKLINLLTRNTNTPEDGANNVEAFIKEIASGEYQVELQAYIDRIRKDSLEDTDEASEGKYFVRRLKAGEEDTDVRTIEVLNEKGEVIFKLPRKALKIAETNNLLDDMIKAFVPNLNNAEAKVLSDAVAPYVQKKNKQEPVEEGV